MLFDSTGVKDIYRLGLPLKKRITWYRLILMNSILCDIDIVVNPFFSLCVQVSLKGSLIIIFILQYFNSLNN